MPSSRSFPSFAGPLIALAAFALVVAARGLRPAPARAATAVSSAVAAASRELPDSAALHDGASSLDELARKVLDGIRQGDHKALSALTVTREEYRALMFPGMAADQQAGADFYYDNMIAGSWKDLARAVGELGGSRIELASVSERSEEAERRGAVVIHRGIELKTRVNGQERSLGLIGGAIEHRGVFKLTRYRKP